MNKLMIGSLGAFLGATMIVSGQERLPAGTNIEIRTTEGIDLRDASDGRIFGGVVARDVYDPNRNLAIRQGSRAELIVRNIGREERALDLESIDVNGRRYVIDAETRVDARQGVGENRRTGEFVGGGALLGTIVGAIAGGGKGAAIGAGAGAAAGAGTQVATRGRAVFVPAESIVTFHLNQPLRVFNGPDNGIMRDGQHYHNDYNRYDNADRNPNDRRPQ
jgi:hypothetical protein